VAWLSIVIIGHVLGYRRDGVVIPVQSVRSVFMYLSCVVLCCVGRREVLRVRSRYC
jgi:hypothetical protein